jgi:hypothetical protein
LLARNVRLTVGVVVAAAAFLVAVVFLAEDSTATGTSAIAAPSAVTLHAPHSALLKPPRVLIAKQLRARPQAKPFGSVLKRSDIYPSRVFAGADDGFALSVVGTAGYPVRTTDGGRIWRINGPQFHIDAADAPEDVSAVGIVNSHSYYAYGSEAADVTTNSGRTWWETFMGEGVAAVVTAPNGQLLAYVYGQASHSDPGKSVVWQYVSSDGGRRWKYSTRAL